MNLKQELKDFHNIELITLNGNLEGLDDISIKNYPTNLLFVVRSGILFIENKL